MAGLGRLSLPMDVVDEPSDPGPGFRSRDKSAVGRGHHLSRDGKKMIWEVYRAFRDDLIRVNTKNVKERMAHSRDKTAWLVEVSDNAV